MFIFRHIYFFKMFYKVLHILQMFVTVLLCYTLPLKKRYKKKIEIWSILHFFVVWIKSLNHFNSRLFASVFVTLLFYLNEFCYTILTHWYKKWWFIASWKQDRKEKNTKTYQIFVCLSKVKHIIVSVSPKLCVRSVSL